MAFTSSQITTLEAHIAKGVTRVDYGDRQVQYGSISEMLRLLAVMRGEVSAASASPPPRRSFVSFNRA